MSTGNYGINRPADITPKDVEIFLQYKEDRNTMGDNLIKLQPEDVLIPTANPNNNEITPELFGGLYTLKLESNIFNKKGFYTIMIKPKEIRTTILDCGVLSSSPDVRGIILDMNSVPSEFLSDFQNNGLTGYRIEYLDKSLLDNTKINNLFTIITSNNKAEPVSQNLVNTNQKAIRYRFNDNSGLVFCTLTPSAAPSIKPNALPYIGVPNQEIIITNTFFNPLMVEIEMVEHDIESLAYVLYGNQTKSLEDGKYTVYNFDNEIFYQANLYEIKDKFTGKPLFEVREISSEIDFNKQFKTITDI